MRSALLAMLSSLLMAPIGFLPKGCSPTPEETKAPEQPSVQVVQTEPEPDREPRPRPQLPDVVVPPENTDPLVPPIKLEGHSAAQPNKRQIGNPTLLIEPAFEEYDFSSDLRAHFHAHAGSVCASGCSLNAHPTPRLSYDRFVQLMADFALEPMSSSSPALEELLFYGRQTQTFLNHYGTSPLDDKRARFLQREIGRQYAYYSFRVVDEHGVVRTEMKDVRVPLDRRHVFDMETHNLQPLETSGTVKRVGLHHLWTRL